MSISNRNCFIPLAINGVSTDQPKDFHVLVAPRPQDARPIREAASHSADKPGLPAAAPASCQPRVTLQRAGEQIVGIQIQCSCGQQIDLACAYQPPTS